MKISKGWKSGICMPLDRMCGWSYRPDVRLISPVLHYKNRSKELITELRNAEENWTHDRIELENSRDRVTELQNQVEELQRQRREVTVSFTVLEVMSKNYRPIGINFSESLKGTDPNEYNTWAYAIKEKLETDEPLYPNAKRKIRYVFSQMKDPIFDVMHFWLFDIEEGFTLEFFFKEIENYMSIHHQKKNVKKKLLIFKMNKTESVSKYYHRLFKFWQRAKTSLEERSTCL